MFLPNVPGAIFIPGATFIPESRVQGSPICAIVLSEDSFYNLFTCKSSVKDCLVPLL